MLSGLRAELRERLPAPPAPARHDIDPRRAPRVAVARLARLRVGPLVVRGTVLDVGAGGAFLHTLLLVEAGEHGRIDVPGAHPVAVRVAWVRGASHPLGPGIGLAFETDGARGERRALELVLRLLEPRARDAANDDA